MATATVTVPLTLRVDEETAKAFEAASAEDREKVQALLGLRLQELVATPRDHATPAEAGDQARKEAKPVLSIEERRARLTQAAGIWKDRDDLPSLAELRSEWDRF